MPTLPPLGHPLADRVASHPKLELGGVRIDALQLDDAANALVRGDGGAVHLCNAYTVALASRDEAFRSTLNNGHLNLPDGMPLIWMARRLGLAHMATRVYGPDLMEATLDRGRASDVRHYLYGSTPEVLGALSEAIGRRWPGAQVVGTESPPFTAIDDAMLAASVQRAKEAGADIVWVGMGTPKQDQLVERMAAIGSQRYVAIGAAFDFIAGNKKQAPKWVQRSGMEWAFRFASEPRRLWKRYVIGNSQFIWAVIRNPRRVHSTG